MFDSAAHTYMPVSKFFSHEFPLARIEMLPCVSLAHLPVFVHPRNGNYKKNRL